MAEGSVYLIFYPHGKNHFYGKTDVFGLALVLFAVASSDLYYRFRKLAQNDFGHTIAYKVRNRIGCYSLIEETYFSIQFFIVLLHQDVRDCVYILALAETVSITKRLGNKTAAFLDSIRIKVFPHAQGEIQV